MIIGLTGPMASGKTTIVEALKKEGFEHITLSDAIREEATKRGVPEEREHLMEVGQSLREEFGAGVLAIRAIEKTKESPDKKWLIDGIRNPAEIDELRKIPGSIVIANTAPEKMIIERILSRKRSDDTLEEEAIRHKLRREWGEGEPEDGQQVGKCVAMADYVFENIVPIEKVEEEFMKLYNQITNQ